MLYLIIDRIEVVDDKNKVALTIDNYPGITQFSEFGEVVDGFISDNLKTGTVTDVVDLGPPIPASEIRNADRRCASIRPASCSSATTRATIACASGSTARASATRAATTPIAAAPPSRSASGPGMSLQPRTARRPWRRNPSCWRPSSSSSRALAIASSRATEAVIYYLGEVIR